MIFSDDKYVLVSHNVVWNTKRLLSGIPIAKQEEKRKKSKSDAHTQSVQTFKQFLFLLLLLLFCFYTFIYLLFFWVLFFILSLSLSLSLSLRHEEYNECPKALYQLCKTEYISLRQRTLFIRTKHNMRIFVGIPFISYVFRRLPRKFACCGSSK